MPITCAGGPRKHPVRAESERKAGVEADVRDGGSNRIQIGGGMRGAPGAPEQHAARLTSLQQTAARVRGTLAGHAGCNWRNLLLWPAAAVALTNPAAFYFLMLPELSAAPQAPTSDL